MDDYFSETKKKERLEPKRVKEKGRTRKRSKECRVVGRLLETSITGEG